MTCPPCHWLIAEPHGPTSQGECRYCGAVKEFWNAIPDDVFSPYNSPGFKGNKKAVVHGIVSSGLQDLDIELMLAQRAIYG